MKWSTSDISSSVRKYLKKTWSNLQYKYEIEKKNIEMNQDRNISELDLYKSELKIGSFDEMILLEAQRFLEKKVKTNVKKCKNCEKIFVGGHKNREYCTYLNEEGITCEEYIKKTRKEMEEKRWKGLKEFNKIDAKFRKRYGIVKAAKIKRQRKEQYIKWKECAMSMEDFVKEIREISSNILDE